jgi:hypothetical protein
MSIMHGAAAPTHAGMGWDAPAAAALDVVVPPLSLASPPARPDSGPGAGRPVLHGSPGSMRRTSRRATSITDTQDIASSVIDVLDMDFETHFIDKNNGVQGGFKAGVTPVGMNKEVPRPSRYTQEQVIAFGGIQEEKMRGVRSSGRLRAQPNFDVTQLERAMTLAEKRAAMLVIGTSASKPNSIIAFSENQIIDNALSLGVSLGKSHSECIKAARVIKDVELQRSLTMLKGSDQLVDKNENTSCLVVSQASDLCDDLEGDDDFMGDDDDVGLPPVINKDRKTRKKKSYDKKNVRRSNRI